MSIIKTEKEIILKTIEVVAELMDNPCSFRKFLKNLGLESKDYEDLVLIIQNYFKDKKPFDDVENLIITKLSNKRYEKLVSDVGYLKDEGFIFDYNKRAEILVIKTSFNKESEPLGKIGIITAGTSDINIAEEAKVIIEESGCEAITSYDVGVAGIHRLFPQIANMLEQGVSVLIVCAGMEGALPSVVAGLVDIPVITQIYQHIKKIEEYQKHKYCFLPIDQAQEFFDAIPIVDKAELDIISKQIEPPPEKSHASE